MTQAGLVAMPSSLAVLEWSERDWKSTDYKKCIVVPHSQSGKYVEVDNLAKSSD